MELRNIGAVQELNPQDPRQTPMEEDVVPERARPGTSGVQAQAGAKPYKRRVVDEYGNEVPDSKRNRAVPDNVLKMNVIKLILHWHES